MKFAVIDVETTGLNPVVDRITEIGVVIIEDFRIISSYTTLVNPEISIPGPVVLLTGIDQQMVSDAPFFESFAEEFDELTRDCIFVGHHVNFDYAFVRNEMKLAGLPFTRSTLCTAELAQLVYPGRKSYSLASLCKQHEVINDRPHRALPDAKATAAIFLKMNEAGGNEIISFLFDKKKGSRRVPVHLRETVYKTLPATPGVYYFIGKNNKPVYIGKAAKIKNRVLSHFRGEGNSLKILAALTGVKEIRFKETGNELLASLLEDHEIRHYWPKLNAAQKKYNLRFGIVYYMDQLNRWRMGITRTGKQHCHIISFHQYHLATQFIHEKVNEYKLNPALCGLPLTTEITIEDHNDSFLKMISAERENKKAEIYFTRGRLPDEEGFIWIEGGKYRGFGFIPSDKKSDVNYLSENLTLRYSSVSSETIISQLIKSEKPAMVIKVGEAFL